MDLIAKRYAQALIGIAIENDSLHTFEEQLSECTNIILKNKDVYEILTNPENINVLKKCLVDNIFTKDINFHILNFIKLLIDKSKINILSDIFIEFQKQSHQISNILDVAVISAFPLSRYESDQLLLKLKKKYDKTSINMNISIDESLIGGFKLIIDNKVIDKSISGMIDAIEHQIISR